MKVAYASMDHFLHLNVSPKYGYVTKWRLTDARGGSLACVGGPRRARTAGLRSDWVELYR